MALAAEVAGCPLSSPGVRARCTSAAKLQLGLPMPKRIAIVEDEAELASLIEYNLVRHGYESLILTGSKGTLKLLEQAKPGLIVLDVMLPDADGFELCRQIRQSPILLRIPVLFLTARSDEVDRV